MHRLDWKTAYPNPDAVVVVPRPAGHGPTFTIAGVMPGSAQTSWPTAVPDPTRDTLDAFGHVITRVEAAARAALPGPVGIRRSGPRLSPPSANRGSRQPEPTRAATAASTATTGTAASAARVRNQKEGATSWTTVPQEPTTSP